MSNIPAGEVTIDCAGMTVEELTFGPESKLSDFIAFIDRKVNEPARAAAIKEMRRHKPPFYRQIEKGKQRR